MKSLKKMKPSQAIKTALFVLAFVGIFTSSQLQAVSLNFGGSSSLNFSSDATKVKESSYSLGLSVDLLSMVRVSYGYKHKVTETDTRVYIKDVGEWWRLRTDQYEDTHSVNVILVLFETPFFAPYVFGGVAQKAYEIERKIESYTLDPVGPITIEVPQYGIGVGIQMSQSFSLKLSNTWSEVAASDFDTTTQTFIDKKKQTSEFEVTASYNL